LPALSARVVNRSPQLGQSISITRGGWLESGIAVRWIASKRKKGPLASAQLAAI
jgi:hypothetical protein